ncbi:MAG: sulfatase [Planctomycetes bacterium]|nr:sulfatase [Planctomycetota bacterium]
MCEPDKSPNIVFVFADQMSANHMRPDGNEDVITPTMDRMAEEGVMCTQHISNCPICSPNRATMLTGTYATTHRLLFNDHQVRTDLPSLATLASRNGYRTGYIGKWHMDGAPRDAFIPPERRLDFNGFWAAYNCHHRYFEPKYYLGDSPELIRRDGYEPEVQTDLALDFLDRQAESADPFVLVVSFGPPHNPYQEVPDKYRERYDADEISFRPNCEEIPREYLDPAWEQGKSTRDFYALVTSLDKMLGSMLTRLEELGMDENTIVVFTSDHGDMLWSHGLLYKCVPYDESIRVPLLVRYPVGLPAGHRVKAPVASVDLLPTLAGLAGWSCPDSVEGTNYGEHLKDIPGAAEPDAALTGIYHRYVYRDNFPVPEWRGLRTDRYTYTETVDRTPWLVFDNEEDPYQMHNLADSAEHEKILSELSSRLAARLDAIGDPFLPKEQMRERFGVTK